MLAFLAKRLASILPTLFLVSVLIFGLQQLLPGDPALALAGEDADPTVIAHLRAKFHLDEPIPVRYAFWAGGVLKGSSRGWAGDVFGNAGLGTTLGNAKLGVVGVVGSTCTPGFTIDG